MNQHGPDIKLPSDSMLRSGFSRQYAPPPVVHERNGSCPKCGQPRFGNEVLCGQCFGRLAAKLRERVLPLLPGGVA